MPNADTPWVMGRPRGVRHTRRHSRSGTRRADRCHLVAGQHAPTATDPLPALGAPNVLRPVGSRRGDSHPPGHRRAFERPEPFALARSIGQRGDGSYVRRCLPLHPNPIWGARHRLALRPHVNRSGWGGTPRDHAPTIGVVFAARCHHVRGGRWSERSADSGGRWHRPLQVLASRSRPHPRRAGRVRTECAARRAHLLHLVAPDHGPSITAANLRPPTHSPAE